MWLLILKYRHVRPREGDKEKYGPFLRNDIDNWSFFKTFFTQFFMFPRYLSALLLIYITGVLVMLMTIGLDRSQPVSKRTYRIVTGLSRNCIRYLVFVFGCVWYRNERPLVDYSHWLGPDWKPSYEGAGVQISNHSNYLDIFLNFLLDDPCPAYLQREGTRVVPVLGFVSDCMQCIFMQRGDTKEGRALILEKIKERQIQSELGLSVPIHIYPEGATTNGSAILPFKKGAFASLRAVKPYTFCYWSVLGNQCFGTPIGFFAYGVIIMNNVASIAVRRELPVFAPNDYFWENHW
jgi:1-acyl-sn-glycerol-3-phosphate acyltransferase